MLPNDQFAATLDGVDPRLTLHWAMIREKLGRVPEYELEIFSAAATFDLPKPIGLFADRLAPEARDALGSAVAAVKWAELPQPKRGDASGATLTIEYARGAQIVHRSFNSYNLELVQAIFCTPGMLMPPGVPAVQMG